jgi:hypothetical protein
MSDLQERTLIDVSGSKEEAVMKRRRPILFTVFVVVRLVIVFLAGQLVAVLLYGGYAGTRMATVSLTISGVIGALWMARRMSKLRWWTRAGYGGPSTWRDTRYLLVAVGMTAVFVFGVIVRFVIPDLSLVALQFENAFLLTFVFEMATRGLALTAMLAAWGTKPRGIARSVWLSALLIQVIGLVVSGGDAPLLRMLNFLVPVSISVCFSILLLRTRAGWPLWIIHSLLSFFSTWWTTLQGEVVNIAIFGPLAVLLTWKQAWRTSSYEPQRNLSGGLRGCSEVAETSG